MVRNILEDLPMQYAFKAGPTDLFSGLEEAVKIVIGGAESNNTRELVDTCSRYSPQVHHVQTELDLCPEWFNQAHAVGITAGTSTPDDVIDRIERRIREIADERGDGASHSTRIDR